MKFRRVSDGRVSPVEAPLDQIADAVEAIRTAKVFHHILVATAGTGKMIIQQEGIRDFKRHLTFMRVSSSDQTNHIQAGPDVLHLLPPEEQRRTGKIWMREGSAPPNWETEHAETVASIRHLAQPTAVAIEELDGEELQRYSLRITPRRNEQDPLLAGVHRHLRRQEIETVTFDVWLTEDGRLRWTREHAVTKYRRPRKPYSFTIDCWDFGVDLTELAIPAPHEILYRA
jgi:hypothetical protein